MRSLAALAAVLLVTAPGVASAAAQPPCLTPAEASSLAAYALPSAITGASKRCAASLGADAYLRRSGTELATRYGALRAQSWPQAKAAFFKMGAGSKDQASALLAGLPDPSLQQMLNAVVEGMVAQKIPTEKCQSIDKIVGLLAPLPAQNMAELLAVSLGLVGTTGGARTDAFAICQS